LLIGVSKSSRLELLEAKAYPSGNVVLRYARFQTALGLARNPAEGRFLEKRLRRCNGV
jgi:hypothetical protein